jgi:hypothetical protein
LYTKKGFNTWILIIYIILTAVFLIGGFTQTLPTNC